MDLERRVLITGGAGFVGCNLASRLIRDGALVDCVDNLITGRIDAIQPLRSHRRFRFFKEDVTRASFLQLGLNTHYDEIYHLACPTGVPNIRTLGEEMVQACSHGTEHVLRIASAHGSRLVYTSSAEVYGDPEESPQHEVYCGNVDPVGPRSAYEEGKRFAETLVRLYADKYQVNGKIVRIFNTYGPGMSPDDTRVIPRFLRNIRDGKKIVVYGDGTQTRTHQYVDDLVAALLLVAHEGARGQVYNIGGDRQLTIMQLVEILRTVTPLPVEVEHKPHFIEDHRGRLPATTKIRSLGWEPGVSLEDGLRKMLVSYEMPILTDRIHDRTTRNRVVRPEHGEHPSPPKLPTEESVAQ